MFSSFFHPELCELPARATSFPNPMDFIREAAPPVPVRLILDEVSAGVFQIRQPGALTLAQLVQSVPPRFRFHEGSPSDVDRAVREVNRMLDRWNIERQQGLYAPDRRYHSFESDGLVFESANQTAEEMRRQL